MKKRFVGAALVSLAFAMLMACAPPVSAEGHEDFVLDAADGADLDVRVQALSYGEGATFRLEGVFDTGATFREEVSVTLWEGAEISGPLVFEQGGELFCHVAGGARVSGGVRADGGTTLSLTNLDVDGGVAVGEEDALGADHSALRIGGEVRVTTTGEGAVGVFSAGDIHLATDAVLSVRSDCQGTWGIGVWAKGDLDVGPYAGVDSAVEYSSEDHSILDVVMDSTAILVDGSLDARVGSKLQGTVRELGSGIGVSGALTLHPLTTLIGEGYGPDNFGIAAGALYTAEGAWLTARGTARGIWIFAQDTKEFILSPESVVESPVIYFAGKVENLPYTTFFYAGEPPAFETLDFHTIYRRIDPPPENMHAIPWPGE